MYGRLISEKLACRISQQMSRQLKIATEKVGSRRHQLTFNAYPNQNSTTKEWGVKRTLAWQNITEKCSQEHSGEFSYGSNGNFSPNRIPNVITLRQYITKKVRIIKPQWILHDNNDRKGIKDQREWALCRSWVFISNFSWVNYEEILSQLQQIGKFIQNTVCFSTYKLWPTIPKLPTVPLNKIWIVDLCVFSEKMMSMLPELA